jgi:hypothetical protein
LGVFVGHHDEPGSAQMAVQGWDDMVLSNLDMDSEALLKYKSQTIAEQITLRDLEVCFLFICITRRLEAAEGKGRLAITCAILLQTGVSVPMPGKLAVRSGRAKR